VEEAETDELRSFLVGYPRRFSSRIAAVEVRRALGRLDQGAEAQTGEVLARLEIIELTSAVAERASAVKPARLRTLDAIHLASAGAVSDEIGVFVTYDARLAEAARALGLAVAAPGSESDEASVS
jgi:predicted nucleic acid-binding protein